jgi:membrane protein YdbS with pleckstrin-like domain
VDETPPKAHRIAMADPAHRPSEKAKLLWAISAGLSWLIPAAGLVGWGIVADAWTTWPFLLAAAIILLAAIVSITVVPVWRYRVHRWEIGADAVYTRSGWFNQERRIAPISRIQTVDTQRGPLDRMLDLSTVTITTASSAGAVTIAALDRPVADRIAQELTEIAARNAEDAT